MVASQPLTDWAGIVGMDGFAKEVLHYMVQEVFNYRGKDYLVSWL